MEVGSWKFEEDGRWKMEDGSLKKLEDGRWKMEDGSSKFEEAGSQKLEGCFLPDTEFCELTNRTGSVTK